jgi:hypothetical protein
VHFALLGTGEEAEHALTNVVQIRSPTGEALIRDLLDFRDPLIDHLLPRPRGAVTGLDQFVDFAEQIDIGQKRLVRAKNSRFVTAATRLHRIVDFDELFTTDFERVFQLLLFRLYILGFVIDDKAAWLRPIDVEGKHALQIQFPPGGARELLAAETAVDFVLAAPEGERCVRVPLTGSDPALAWSADVTGTTGMAFRAYSPVSSVGGVGAGLVSAVATGVTKRSPGGKETPC